MAKVELIMPKMGESIMEATILKWRKKIGDKVELDEAVLDIATDKVDSEVPSPVQGVITEILYAENDVVQVGKPIAIVSTEQETSSPNTPPISTPSPKEVAAVVEEAVAVPFLETLSAKNGEEATASRFYSPLVRNMAKEENIGLAELEAIPGTGQSGRLTKADLASYISNRKETIQTSSPVVSTPSPAATATIPISTKSQTGQEEIIEMDRMRRLIADHMVMSKHTSPHVTSFIEIDVTEMVQWREKIKLDFERKYNEKITYTPIFIQAVAKAICDFPMINVSVDGTKIIVKKQINVGMATALPTGNLIVPVIRNADQYNLLGLTKQVNDLANRARKNQLKPDEIQGGTFTLTNVGTFGNLMGTPIINQPQVAIMSVGAIKKKPAVIETQYGDVIAIRQMMFLSLSYDHRVVDGFLGGSFLRRVGDYLEAFKGE